MFEHDARGRELRPRGLSLDGESRFFSRRGVVPGLDPDLTEAIIVAGPDDDVRSGCQGDGGLASRLHELDHGWCIGHHLHLVDPRLRIRMAARREQVDGVARRLLEQELRDQGLAVVAHLALDGLASHHEVAASNRCRGMDLQLGPGELGCLEIALVLLDGLAAPLQIGRKLIGRLDLGDGRLLVHGNLVKLGLRVANLQPVLQGRQNLGKRGDVPGVRLVGKHGLSGLGLAGLADEERGGVVLVRRVVDLGGDLQARTEQDLGVSRRDLEDLDRAHRGDERERMQDPACRGTPGGDHGAAQEGQAQHQAQHRTRLE